MMLASAIFGLNVGSKVDCDMKSMGFASPACDPDGDDVADSSSTSTGVLSRTQGALAVVSGLGGIFSLSILLVQRCIGPERITCAFTGRVANGTKDAPPAGRGSEEVELDVLP